MPVVFSTTEVGRICHVATRTVANWFDRGQLKGFRVPGSKFRRIPRESLVEFMELHGMPVEWVPGETKGE